MKAMSQLRGGIKRVLRPFCLRVTGGEEPRRCEFPPSVRVRSPQETLRVCRELIANKTRGAYLRFGDGDVNLLHGEDELFQSSDVHLSKEMQEAFDLQGVGIMKALPLHSPRFGIWPGMEPGIHGAEDEWTERLLAHCYPYFIGTPIYSAVALPYIAAFDPATAVDFLRFLKEQSPIFVGNGNVSEGIVSKLFGETAHIRTPDHSSYAEIDRIEQETVDCLRQFERKFKVIVIAMGCSGRVLAKRIYQGGSNVFLFDFGSLLDALCGWNTRAWMELAPYDVRELLIKLE